MANGCKLWHRLKWERQRAYACLTSDLCCSVHWLCLTVNSLTATQSTTYFNRARLLPVGVVGVGGCSGSCCSSRRVYSSRPRPAWRAAAAWARRSAFSVRTGMRLPVGVLVCPSSCSCSCSCSPSSSCMAGSSGCDCCCCCCCWRRRCCCCCCCNAGGMTTLTFGLGNSDGLGVVSLAGVLGVGVALTFSRCFGILLGACAACA